MVSSETTARLASARPANPRQKDRATKYRPKWRTHRTRRYWRYRAACRTCRCHSRQVRTRYRRRARRADRRRTTPEIALAYRNGMHRAHPRFRPPPNACRCCRATSTDRAPGCPCPRRPARHYRRSAVTDCRASASDWRRTTAPPKGWAWRPVEFHAAERRGAGPSVHATHWRAQCQPRRRRRRRSRLRRDPREDDLGSRQSGLQARDRQAATAQSRHVIMAAAGRVIGPDRERRMLVRTGIVCLHHMLVVALEVRLIGVIIRDLTRRIAADEKPAAGDIRRDVVVLMHTLEIRIAGVRVISASLGIAGAAVLVPAIGNFQQLVIRQVRLRDELLIQAELLIEGERDRQAVWIGSRAHADRGTTATIRDIERHHAVAAVTTADHGEQRRMIRDLIRRAIAQEPAGRRERARVIQQRADRHGGAKGTVDDIQIVVE